MRKIGIAGVLLLAFAWEVPVFGQDEGENPPIIDSVDLTIARFTGGRDFAIDLDFIFLLDLYGIFFADLYEWPPVPFDPAVDLAQELDLIFVDVVVIDADLAGEDSDEEFFYRVRAWGSIGPPEAPPLFGATHAYEAGESPMPVTPPPDNAVLIDFVLDVPQFDGVNQARLRDQQDWDVRWLVEIRISNEESPAEEEEEGGERGVWAEYAFVLKAIENPALRPPNPPPFADAGPDQTVGVGSTATLDGSRTFDSTNLGFEPTEPSVFEKDTLEYTWEWISGPERVDPVPKDDNNPATAQVTLEVETWDSVEQRENPYVYRLLVDDGVNPLPSTDTVNIYVHETLRTGNDNKSPQAEILRPDGELVNPDVPIVVEVGQTVVLQAREDTDPDGDPVTYHWRQTNEVGGPLTSDEAMESFQPLGGVNTPIVSWETTAEGTYYFALLVTDVPPAGVDSLSAEATVVVQVVAATAGQTAARESSEPVVLLNDSPEEDLSNDPPAVPAGCGGGLLPLAILPALLWMMRGRRR